MKFDLSTTFTQKLCLGASSIQNQSFGASFTQNLCLGQDFEFKLHLSIFFE